MLHDFQERFKLVLTPKLQCFDASIEAVHLLGEYPDLTQLCSDWSQINLITELCNFLLQLAVREFKAHCLGKLDDLVEAFCSCELARLYALLNPLQCV